MDVYERARERLKQLIHQTPGEDFASVARLIGKNSAYIHQYIHRKSPKELRERDRLRIARHFGVPSWQLGGPQPGEFSQTDRGVHEPRLQGLVFIPSLDVRVSAGDGAIAPPPEAEDYLPVHGSWLRKITSSSTEHLAVLKVSGDSMHPTLSDGDQVLIDLNQRDISRDGIYVLRHGEAMHVKRLSLNPQTRMASVRSDNPLYPSWKAVAEDDLSIIGRVIWMGRRM